MLGVLGASGALVLVGCGDSGSNDTGDGSTGSTGGTSSGSSSSSGTPTSTGVDPTTGDGSSSTGVGDTSSGDGSSSTGDTAAECTPADAWATGGTAAMTAKACYPDPFAGGVTGCPLLCQTTAGPCTADTMDRQDVSEGYGGLPVRLSLLIVDADTCQPLPNVRVQIWHTQRTGVYSGNTPNPQMCSGGDSDAPNHLYFRGTRTAGADGRVDFDTCFPGWYMGRALHIHFSVHLDGDEYVTSQLFFDDTITEEIFSSHPDYSEFGQPDTHNDDDNIIGGADDLPNYILDIARMPDGAMLASKVIGVRSSLADPLCSLGGGGPP